MVTDGDEQADLIKSNLKEQHWEEVKSQKSHRQNEQNLSEHVSALVIP